MVLDDLQIFAKCSSKVNRRMFLISAVCRVSNVVKFFAFNWLTLIIDLNWIFDYIFQNT